MSSVGTLTVSFIQRALYLLYWSYQYHSTLTEGPTALLADAAFVGRLEVGGADVAVGGAPCCSLRCSQ